MANLAIKGHATRGKEVIEILGILGGSNAFGHVGNNPLAIYYIDGNDKKNIICSNAEKVCDCIIFTLEEFLENFPYKVGDKVSSKYLENFKIEKMEWEDANNRVIYKLQGMGWYRTYELQLYDMRMLDKIQQFPRIEWKSILDAPSGKIVFVLVDDGCCHLYTQLAWKNEFGEWVDIPHCHSVRQWAEASAHLTFDEKQ